MKKLLLLLLSMLIADCQADSPPSILVLGDSLSAAHGIDLDHGWVTLLQSRLQAEGYPHRVVNASTSGDTTAGGVSRLPQALQRFRPSILILELGSNDGLRGLDFGTIRGNLASMIDLARDNGCRVLLIGMHMPPNFGKAFTERFHAIFTGLSQDKAVPLVPFLLEGVVDRPGWLQEDRLHPTALAQPRMLENVWPLLQPLLQRISK
ncbi:MAG: arylesterase [Gammaproteobacteria bacterium]|nr:arylesterase [Gammaproteobacteria bacterium]